MTRKGWTIITADGLQLCADGIFNEAEARAYVAENPHTLGGSRQLAVPDHIAHAANAERKRIGAEAARLVSEARVAAVAKLFELDWTPGPVVFTDH
jgi:hypothetical protein